MATVTSSLNHDQIEDLVGDISAAQLASASATDLTFVLTYSGDDLPHASTLHVSGTFAASGNTVSGGTVTGLAFLDATGASLLTIGGLALDYAQVAGLLANPDTFEDFVDHLGEARHDHFEFGNDNDDHMHGDHNDDVMLGGGGNDAMSGGRGNDDLSGGDGDDDLTGGLGDDHLDGGRGHHDRVSFESAKKVVVDLSAGTAKGEGNDTLVGIEDAHGTRGSDVLVGDANANELLGDAGNDKLSGLGGDDHVDGGAGNDFVDGGDGNNLLDGGDGNDKVAAGAGNDEIHGGSGNDNINAGAGLNLIFGDSGNDKIVSGDDADNVSGGDGNDTIMANGGDDLIDGGAGNDNIKAGAGNDSIDGGDGNDNMAGGAGDDTYYVSGGKDKITEFAGDGNDTVVSSLSFSVAKLANVENVQLSGIGNIDATGNAGANVLTGNAGNNVLDGAGGDDVLIGAAGADTLTGGAGADTFLFDNLAVGGADTVKDLIHGSDVLALDADVFTALVGSLDLNANVVVGAAAVDANDFLVFDATTGALFYDQDGSGAGAAIQIATLTGVTSVTGADFTLV